MKERLTGAIILVVLVVALVPELLSGPAPGPAERAVTTPDGAAIRTVRVDLAEPAAPVGAGAAATMPASAAAAPPTPAARAASGTPATAVAAPDSLALTAAGTPPGNEPASAAPDATVPVPERPTPDPVVHRPRPTLTPVARAGGAGKDAYVVQAGTFSSRANATRLAHELGAKGLAARVSSVTNGGKEMFRVRVGAPGDRATASALLARVKAAGSGATLIPVPSQAVAGP